MPWNKGSFSMVLWNIGAEIFLSGFYAVLKDSYANFKDISLL